MASETARLQQAWAAKGDPPCLHPQVEDEYYTSPDGETSSRTADQVCLTCGACFYAGNTVEEDRARQRARLEGHDSGGDEGDRR